MGTKVAVALCGGGSCRRKHEVAYAGLAERLRAGRVVVEEVRCLGSCSGPTAVLRTGGRVMCFTRLRKRRVQQDLVALALGKLEAPTARLVERALRGSRLRKVEGRLARAARRRQASMSA